MKKNQKQNDFSTSFRRAIGKIHLVDKCLILFMLILLMQAGYSLFTEFPTSTGVSNIDVVLRTSASSIFGYFISANFIRKHPSTQGKGGNASAKSISAQPTTTPTAQIGFSTEMQQEEAPQLVSGATQKNEFHKPELQHRQLQVLVTAVIGLFSLSALIIYRNFWEITMQNVGTISQLRDFVSGCVGFLIGSVTSREEED